MGHAGEAAGEEYEAVEKVPLARAPRNAHPCYWCAMECSRILSEVREAPKAFGGFGQEEEVHQAAAERAACSVQPMMEHLMKKESLPMNGGANEQCS